MSNTAAFELRSDLSRDIIRKEVNQIWKGYDADISSYNNHKNNDIIFCDLLYIFGYPEEEEQIREVIDYLLSIALEQQVYYYRCSDFIGGVDKNRIVEITVDDIFTDQYRPSIGASIVEKYLIRIK